MRCVPNFFVWQIFWRSWGTRTLFRIFHPVFVRGDRMLGVECSLPATVWTEGCRAGFGRLRERMWFSKEGREGTSAFLLFLVRCVPNFFVWQIFWRICGTRTLFRIFHPVFVRGDRMLGVECSLPARVWTEGCRADSGGGGGGTARCNSERTAAE